MKFHAAKELVIEKSAPAALAEAAATRGILARGVVI
jgi:hypothetical protein